MWSIPGVPTTAFVRQVTPPLESAIAMARLVIPRSYSNIGSYSLFFNPYRASGRTRSRPTVDHYEGSKEQGVIQSLLNAEVIFQRHRPGEPVQPPVVTLSRDHGAGGAEVARLLGQRLRVEVYDRQILDSIAEHAKVDTELMAQLDEKVAEHKSSAWIRSLFTNNTAFPESYRHHLVNVVLGICNTGGIIMGRGAHVILTTRPVFRVRLTGSLERCVERVAARRQLAPEQAREEVERTNKERGEFLWEMFHRRLNDPTLFDLIINTDNFPNLEAVTDLILVAMQQAGLIALRSHGGER